MRRASISSTLFLTTVLGATMLAPSHASAQDDTEDAIATARTALRDGDTELAIDILEEAREASTDPTLRYELYVAYEQGGELETAASHLEAYLASARTLGAHERASLEGHLADLRAALAPPPSGDLWSDPAIGPIGWTFFAAGIAGLITFVAGATATLVIEQGLSGDCREDHRLCAPGERDPIGTAWAVAGVGLGAGVVLGAIGAALLVVAGEDQRGASESLPPDLDPTVQRPFSLLPWIDPRDGGGAGATLRVTF